MAELTFKSPGVSTKEIDLSGPTSTGPTGVPAGVIGTADQGRAFVPITMATFADFVAEFGNTDGSKFGPMAMRQWLSYAQAGTYLRVLGVGDGKRRSTTTGVVTNAGFVVGEQLPKGNGILGNNVYAGANDPGATAAIAATDIASDYANLDTFTVFVPTSGAGSDNHTVTVKLLNTLAAAAANTIQIKIAGGNAATAADVAALIAMAVAGTNPNGVTLPSTATAATSDITYASTGAGQITGAATEDVGIFGLSCARGSGGTNSELTFTATSAGQNGNDIVFTDTVGNFVATIFGASPTSPTGGLEANGHLGRAHFLAVCMRGSTLPNSTKTMLTDAGLEGTAPLLRGVILAASGVLPTLSASRADGITRTQGTIGEGGYGGGLFSGNNLPTGAPTALNLAASSVFGDGVDQLAGSTVGAVDIAGGKQEFVMLLNGHTHTDAYPTVITASFDPQAPNYLGNVLNTDPFNTQKAGHLLYSHYPVYSDFAVPTGSHVMGTNYAPTVNGVIAGKAIKYEDIAFLVTSSLGRNGGSATIPDFEGFRDRFRSAKMPKIISQKFGGKNLDLFRICCLDDGKIGNHRVKVSIENINKSTNVNNKFGTFDLLVRDFDDTDDLPVVIESFKKLSLNPIDERYISRVIGDYHLFYDFDKRVGSQKLVVEGSYPNRSNFIRVEPTDALDKGDVPAGALPVGFRGIDHLVTSGSSIFNITTDDFSGGARAATYITNNIVQPPIQYRASVSRGKSPRKILASNLYWGVQFEKKESKTEPNKSTVFDAGLYQWGTYFPNFRQDQQAALVGDNVGIADSSGTVLDCDRFNNNKFSLENVQVVVTAADKADSNQWAAATYRRSGVAENMTDIDGSAKTTASGLTRLLSIEKDFGLSSARKFLKFTTIAQGGFDGQNLFDREKVAMSSTACKREMDDSNQGETQGPTVAAYRKALDILEERSDVSIQLLAIPGIKHSSVTDYAMATVEDRFDALYIMDIETQDNLGKVVTGSNAMVSVTNTVSGFTSRNLDSSFAAAYFPDVIMREAATGQNVVAPASVAVLGAFGLNDSVAYPWFAPAGFTRGALKDVSEANVKLNRENLDALYEADINPITAFPQSREVVVFGQKTLQAAQSALDRVNVRRLLIDIRRQVRAIGDTFLFEPNREATLGRFSSAVTPILTRIQAQQGLERFKVQIDTTTTTQADIENNTVRGKIFLQPVRSVEFISLDFVVTNAGMDI